MKLLLVMLAVGMALSGCGEVPQQNTFREIENVKVIGFNKVVMKHKDGTTTVSPNSGYQLKIEVYTEQK